MNALCKICLSGWIALVALSSTDGRGQDKKAPSPAEKLDQLLKLTPAERMRHLAKALDKDKDVVSATRGALTETIVERGTLQAVQASEVICRVRAVGSDGSTIASVIKWIVDDGAVVKKGDKLIELDSSAHADLLPKQKGIVAKAEGDEKRAAAELQRIRQENHIDIGLAKIDVRLAELSLKQYKGNDALQRETLALQVERAALLVERVKLQGTPREDKANDDFQAKRSVHERERNRLRELEQDIANCVMTAPRDGIVVYYVPEQARFSVRGQRALVAQGEPVREAQKLLSVVDLKRMAISTRIHESVIHKVRVGQKVKARIDAFPDRADSGKVTEVSATASQADFLAANVKVYAVTVTLDGENKDLRPGMSAEMTILVGERPNCLRLPATAVLGKGKGTFCYVLTGNELHVRKITVGLRVGELVEITNGLKEGELVLRDPGMAVGRVSDKLP